MVRDQCKEQSGLGVTVLSSMQQSTTNCRCNDSNASKFFRSLVVGKTMRNRGPEQIQQQKKKGIQQSKYRRQRTYGTRQDQMAEMTLPL
jgi:hypothetical protein